MMNSLFAVGADSIDMAGRSTAQVARRIARSLPTVPSLVQDTVELTRNHASLQAGAAVIRTANETVGRIVDLIA